jgi:glycosyltransferase involved in cell wall biosynthesis
MSKPFLLYRAPVQTRSGYGAHSRDILYSLRELNKFDIAIDSCAWGSTSMTGLEEGNEFHDWIKSKITYQLNSIPDVYIQVTVPNEFRKIGKFNIGITAGIETTIAPKDWIDGCNNMDLVITTSKFSRDVLVSTVYNETDKLTGKLIKQYKIEKPVKILFEGVDLNVFNDTPKAEFNLDIKEDFAYLFVGHWLKGDLGQDRKDVGMLITTFANTFNGVENKPALVLKTSSSYFSVKDREVFIKRIQDLVKNLTDPPSIYLVWGELTDDEMNNLYNHPKIKAMVTITKGEGFGRPLLEFTLTGKPVIASSWSGHIDFLPKDKAVLVGGQLTDVHESAIDKFILKSSKWFTANYKEFSELLKFVQKDYDEFLIKAQLLKEENKNKFSIQKMTELLGEYLQPISMEKPKETKLILPKLTKVK